MKMVAVDQNAMPIPAEQPDAKQAFAAMGWQGTGLLNQASEYWIDAWQRSILFLDLLRERGNEHFRQIERMGPNVLSFEYELVMDGRNFDRPVCYCLVRILPPEGVTIDPQKRPFIVFDPRAGHGPGIGGMKHESEIGVALGAGHPCYFVGFLPEPVRGQTIEDVCRAEVRFVEQVAELHPNSQGKPCLIGNCQAGWQIMMLSAVCPDLVGPIVLAGSPLSYWAGVHGKNPMRYLGGLLGGTWLTTLAGDLGHDIFDGANLVCNFENNNPSNTFWKKNYHAYSNVDTEAPRFLEFEKWWGSPVLMNAGEMQWIADNLFIGNKLSSGEIFVSDGTRVDLRNIKSPIIVFCSWGDDITPPQQALGWILDIHEDDEALVASGQTIVYALHQSIGHLGIFVSAKVATKEHEEFARTMDLIDALPPGLYEAVFLEKSAGTPNLELVAGDYIVRFERRGLDDIRQFGGNDADDDRRFAAVARLSELNQSAYRTFLSPAVKAITTEQTAAWLRRLHPHRVRFEIFSDKNPWLAPVSTVANSIRAMRKPVAADNPFLVFQETVSNQIVEALDQYRDMRDQAVEAFFLNFYGAPTIQAMVGLNSDAAVTRMRIGRDVVREAIEKQHLAELEQRVEQGGIVEACLRALFYVGAGYSHQAIDERVFSTLRQLHQRLPERHQLSLSQFKEITREQFLLLHYGEEHAVVAISGMLPADATERRNAFAAIVAASEAAGALQDEARQRLARIEVMFIGSNAAAHRQESKISEPAAREEHPKAVKATVSAKPSTPPRRPARKVRG